MNRRRFITGAVGFAALIAAGKPSRALVNEVQAAYDAGALYGRTFIIDRPTVIHCKEALLIENCGFIMRGNGYLLLEGSRPVVRRCCFIAGKDHVAGQIIYFGGP